MTAPISHDDLMAGVEKMLALGETAPRLARDPVNQPQINTWLEAIGDGSPTWRTGVAPPAMAQVWTMYGLDPARPSSDPLHGTMRLLDEAGYTSVLGTNCDQTYARLLEVGEQVAITSRLESVVGPKTTGVGEGYFVTTVNTWWVGDEPVATMLFRVLKFKPRQRVDRSQTVRPVINRDTSFFWDGTAVGELRIQCCNACGALRHPPGPVCPTCHATDRGYVVASGRGTVHSWLVHHAPAVPGKQLPLTLALVELEEGVRMVGELLAPSGGPAPAIGQAVEATYTRIDEALTLVGWRPVDPARNDTEPADPARNDTETRQEEPGQRLPGWELPITPTLVVSTALATRDFQDVHHDRDLAVQRGSKDIFLNILSTTGLVQRYVSEWVGVDARITACALRLGAPAYPGDTLAFTGTVVSDEAGTVVVDVLGSVSLGAHVNARVTLERA